MPTDYGLPIADSGDRRRRARNSPIAPSAPPHRTPAAGRIAAPVGRGATVDRDAPFTIRDLVRMRFKVGFLIRFIVDAYLLCGGF